MYDEKKIKSDNELSGCNVSEPAVIVQCRRNKAMMRTLAFGRACARVFVASDVKK